MKIEKIETLEDYLKFINGLWDDNDYENDLSSYSVNGFFGKDISRVENENIEAQLNSYDDYMCKYEGYARKRIKPTDFVFYRGQDDASYDLVPSIYRNNQISHESEYYHEIMVRCHEYFKGASHLDRLVTMQHFGIYTRLLDITANPLVALYFACMSSKSINSDQEKDGKVFVFTVANNALKYSDSDGVLMLSCIPAFNQFQQNQLRIEAYKNLGNIKIPLLKSGRAYYDRMEKFYSEITRENPAFQRKIQAIDLLKPLFVKPEQSNPRIIRQDGAFIISGLNATDKEASWKNNKYVYSTVKIPAKRKGWILNELDHVGINRATLFPDIENVGLYLRGKQ